MLTCNDCIHSDVCVRQKIYGEYAITECKGHFLGKASVVENGENIVRVPTLYPMGAMTFAVACSVCKNEGKEFCKECRCEIESHFEIK